MPERVSLLLPPLGIWKENCGWVDCKHESLEKSKTCGERAGTWGGWLGEKKWLVLKSSAWLAERRQDNFLEMTDPYYHLLCGLPPSPVLFFCLQGRPGVWSRQRRRHRWKWSNTAESENKNSRASSRQWVVGELGWHTGVQIDECICWGVYRVILQENKMVKDREGSWWGQWHWSTLWYVRESGCFEGLVQLVGNCHSLYGVWWHLGWRVEFTGLGWWDGRDCTICFRMKLNVRS